MKYINDTHRRILEKISEAGLVAVYPIMLTANQFEETYMISLNFSGTGIRIPKSDIDLEDIREINSNENTRIILNRVWEAQF